MGIACDPPLNSVSLPRSCPTRTRVCRASGCRRKRPVHNLLLPRNSGRATAERGHRRRVATCTYHPSAFYLPPLAHARWYVPVADLENRVTPASPSRISPPPLPPPVYRGTPPFVPRRPRTAVAEEAVLLRREPGEPCGTVHSRRRPEGRRCRLRRGEESPRRCSPARSRGRGL